MQDAQGTLHPYINNPESAPTYALTCYRPDRWCRAIAVAGELLRKAPETKLCDIEITSRMIGDSPGIGHIALQTILNASRNPDATNTPSRTFQARNVKRIDTCEEAEEVFEKTLDAMKEPESAKDYSRDGRKRSWAIITDDTNTPIAIKKLSFVPSALSLAPLTVNGITYPAGSLYRMDTSRALATPEGSRYNIPSSELGGVAFMRLSAFAFPTETRSSLFTDCNLNSSAKMTLDDIRDIANESLEYTSEPAFLFDLPTTR